MGISKVQIGGSHYRDLPMQPIDFILANNIPFCEGNAIKYICRHRVKGGVQDIEKAIHYLEMVRDDYRRREAKAPSQAQKSYR